MADELYGESGLNAEVTEVTNDPVQTPEAPQPAPSEPTAPTQAPQQGRSHDVPLTVMLEIRDQLKAQKARADAAEARWHDHERKQQEARAKAPNMFDDPDGYHAWVEDRISSVEAKSETRVSTAVLTERLFNSEDKWRDKLGDDKFDELFQWTGTMGDAWVAHAEKQRDPFGFAYKEFQKIERAQRAEQLEGQLQGKSLDEVIAERVAAALAEREQQAPSPARPRKSDGTFAPSPPPQRQPPPSLSQVSAAAAAVTGDSAGASALEGLYGDR